MSLLFIFRNFNALSNKPVTSQRRDLTRNSCYLSHGNNQDLSYDQYFGSHATASQHRSFPLSSVISRHSLIFYYYNQSIYQMDPGESAKNGSPPYPYKSPYPFLPTSDKTMSKWIKLGLPLFVVAAIAGIVVGAVVGTRKNENRSISGTTGSSGVPGSASSAVSAKLAIGRFATATDSEFMVPLYPSTVSP